MAVLILPLRFEKKVKGVLKNELLSMYETAPLTVKKYARFVLSYVNQCVLKKIQRGLWNWSCFCPFCFHQACFDFFKTNPLSESIPSGNFFLISVYTPKLFLVYFQRCNGSYIHQNFTPILHSIWLTKFTLLWHPILQPHLHPNNTKTRFIGTPKIHPYIT